MATANLPIIMSDPATQLRELLDEREYLFAPGISTPLEAKVAEIIGLDVVTVSGFLTNLCQYGHFDGTVGMAEMVDTAERVAKSTDVLVKADADTGYGGVHNVQRTIREYIDAGVAAVHIEDQDWPKRCGHAAGKEIVSRADAEARIRAAVDARDEHEDDLFIVARTDAYGSANGDWEEHVERGKLFWELGADMIAPEMPDNSVENAVRFVDQVRETHPEAIFYWNYSSNFQWTDLEEPPTFEELADLGYKYINVSGFGCHAAVHALYDAFENLKNNEAQAQWEMEELFEGHERFDRSSEVLFDLADFEEYQQTEEKYLEGAAERYDSSEGFRIED